MRREYVEMRIGCNPEDLSSFLRLLLMMQECCLMGSNQTFKVIVDGDGSANLKLQISQDGKWQDFNYLTDSIRDEVRQRLRKDKAITVHIGE